MFFEWYYPAGFYRNAIVTDTVAERGALMWLFLVVFMIFTSTFSHHLVAGVELAETASFLANIMFSMCLIFCGYVLYG
jgi:ATP-binding cassette subfamily G (WHITE) protein 2 (PDR)